MCDGQELPETPNCTATPTQADLVDELALDEVPTLSLRAPMDDFLRAVNPSYQTPQHLGTLLADNRTYSTSPLIVHTHDKSSSLLLAGCQTGHICIWDLTELVWQRTKNRNNMKCDSSVPMKETMDTLLCIPPVVISDSLLTSSPAAPVSQIVAIPYSACKTNGYTDERTDCCTVVAANALGTVAALKLQHSRNEDKNGIISTSTILLTVAALWNTGHLGIRSITTTTETSDLPCTSIVLGYSNGLVESWALHSPTQESVQEKNDINALWEPRLRWRGSFDNEYSHHPIVTGILRLFAYDDKTQDFEKNTATTDTADIAPLNRYESKNTTDAKHRSSSLVVQDETNMCEPSSRIYLILSLLHDSHQSSSITIEVVDATSVELAWRYQTATTDPDMAKDSSKGCAIALDEHCILPEAGREFIDTLTISMIVDGDGGDFRRPSRRRHWIPSDATNCMCALPSSHRVAIALADGRIVLLRVSPPSNGLSLCWGVDQQQYTLPYPVVGLESLERNVNGKQSTFLVCCLRGTSTYMISIDDDDANNENEAVVAFSVPHDIDEDVNHRYVQGFTAGPISFPTSPDRAFGQLEHEHITTLVYAWPCGLLSVYASEILYVHHTPFEPIMALHRELVSNGSAELLRTILLASDETKNGRLEILSGWTAARDEILRHQGPIPMDTSGSDYAAFRVLLYQLAKTFTIP